MRLSCRAFAANAFRLQLHALAYNLGNFIRTLAIRKTAGPCSLTSLRGKLIKIGAKVVSYGRYVTFQMAEVAAPRQMFTNILALIARLPPPPARPHDRRQEQCGMQAAIGNALIQANAARLAFGRRQLPASIAVGSRGRRFSLPGPVKDANLASKWPGIW
jgi:Transposase DDE domain group 1